MEEILKHKIWGFKSPKEEITYCEGEKGERRERKGKKGERGEKGEGKGGEVSFYALSSFQSDLQVVIKRRRQRNSRNK